MPHVVEAQHEYTDHVDRPCRFRLRIFRDPDRPVVVLMCDHERQITPGAWRAEDPYVGRMRDVHRDVLEQHELDPDCVCWIERDRGGRLERVDYGRSVTRWRVSPAALDYLSGAKRPSGR